jgi:chromosome segregation protein
MRLTQIKLAGFKSFVDATAINVPGKLVGVVGPNGCGKSNIIDAVRWVLGESRAAALRGDSMQDVIFNGSSNRDPVARCSVELAFDNSLGKAAGSWSQYAEISVKRVLQRDGESSYFINNTHVRRRDVQDIFLGTGLGPRAYAIIEQGMISRIIEAKPEDVRVFLEEAAGISKYKERRRETEHRLSDTRENLSRVTDIRQELGVQIEKLEGQAEIAQRYKELSAEKQLKQNLLALLRRNEARLEAEKHAQQIERSVVDLEQETAALREIERELEATRVEHYAAADAMSAAQAELYQANAEVSRLESEIRFSTETRQRIDSQIAQSHALRDAGERQAGELREASAMWQARLEEARARLEAAKDRVAAESERLPEAEQAYRHMQEQLQAQRTRMAQSEKALHLEQAHVAHAERNLQGLETRAQRLESEKAELAAPEAAALAELEAELERSRNEMQRQESLLEQLEEARLTVEEDRATAQQRIQTLERELSGLDAKLLTLQDIQRKADENRDISDWISRHSLSSVPRLWQRIKAEPGWETAVESVLRERLHALELGDADALQRLLDDPPSGRATAYTASESSASQEAVPGAVPLMELVTVLDERFRGTVQALLRGWHAVEGLPPLETRLGLDTGAWLVNRQGHQYSRFGVSFHAPDPADSGLLARQREIEDLEADVRRLQEDIEAARDRYEAVVAKLEEHAQAVLTLRAAGDALRQRLHERQLEQVRRSEEQERFARRSAQIDAELAEIAGHRSHEEETRARAAEALGALEREQTELADGLESIAAQFREAEAALQAQRQTLKQAELEEQDAGFLERESSSKISDIERSLANALEQVRRAVENAGTLQAELAGLPDADLRDQLQTALAAQSEREQALGQARSRQEEMAATLRQHEESRLEREQRLQPLRDRIADLRLKEQAARLNLEQFAAQLAEAGADENELAGQLKEGQRAAPLQGEITRLTNAVNELGAINMAALDELATSRERKDFLDAQAGDLSEALEILDNAIRRIDRETRELLQNTFTTVNTHFGQMFPALFGGGEARLEMTGEEVLDCGVQIIARPPGKKNASIHLLSGGEKALTAIALVFSMFQLNPAPFCLLDEVDAPLDDANTERFCRLVSRMSEQTQFLFISHNKLTMEMANQLIGVTMQEQGVSRVVAVDIEEALKLREPMAA